MSPIEVLSYIYYRRPDIWRVKAKLNHRRLLEILEIKGPQSMITEAFQSPSKISPQLKAALNNNHILEKITEAFGNRAMFSVGSESELISTFEELSSLVQIEMLNKPLLVTRNRNEDVGIKELCFSQSEENASNNIPLAISKATTRILHWSVEKFTGANFLISSLTPDSLSDSYEEIIYLTPSSAEEGFDLVATMLGDHLQLNASDLFSGQAIWDVLDRRKALVIFKHTEYLAKITSKRGANPLINAIISCRNHNKKNHTPRVLLVGQYDFPRNFPFTDISNDIGDLQVSDKERFAFFLRQLKRFHKLRGYSDQYEDGGFRSKRAKWQIGLSDSIERNPIDIRMRALFCSNIHNYSYFDPTAGFDVLVGDLKDDLPLEAQEYITAANLYIGSWLTKKRKSELQVLRWISTGVYWLTGSMMQELRTRSLGRSIAIDQNSLDARLADLSDIVSIHEDNEVEVGRTQETYFVMPLALKALVQDNWKAHSPFDRALSHYKVAVCLYQNQNNKLLLETELPYKPHWGRTRHYFLHETIRHLMRACEQAELRPITSKKSLGFPNPPEENIIGGCCDPYEVTRFCYENLFHIELNGNTVQNRSRTLSNRHGAYHMVAEILQFLSNDYSLGIPHEAFPQEHQLQYYEEAAFACLDLGDISQSIKNFESALLLSGKASNHEAIFRAILNLALVKTVAGSPSDYSQAKTLINEAGDLINTLKSDFGTGYEKLGKSRLLELSKRLKTRAAHMFMVCKDIGSALEIYESFDKKTLRRDTAFWYIKALLYNQPKNNADVAMQVCLENIFHNTSKGHHHEALVFRILLSSILRSINLLDAAEKNMDLVQRDVLDFGCSERTFQSFLLEAGIILVEQKRYSRAYCIYLKPCLVRSYHRGFFGSAEETKKYAHLALEKLQEALTDITTMRERKVRVDELMRPRSKLSQKLSQVGRHLLPSDPLSSYDFVYPEETVKKLYKYDGVDKELDEILKFD